MADVVVTAAVVGVDASRRRFRRVINVTFNTGDYVSGGIPLDLTAVTNPSFFDRGANFARIPVQADASVLNHPQGYVLVLQAGAALTNWKMRIFRLSTGAELTVAAMPAGIAADTGIEIQFTEPILC